MKINVVYIPTEYIVEVYTDWDRQQNIDRAYDTERDYQLDLESEETDVY